MSGAANPAPVGDPIIRVEDITIGYGDRVLMSGVGFEVRRGEVFVILGGSGCGKSSLLKNLIGLEKPMKGRILVGGRDVAQAEGDERQALLRSFGVMYQSGALFGSLSVHENVRLPLDEFTDLSLPQRDVLAHTRLKMVGMGHAGKRMPSELSGGMKKRAAIARALALDPPLVFLDEPSAGLDPVTSAGLDVLILDLARNFGITFVVVTHELLSIFAIADRCVMLDASRNPAVGELDVPHMISWADTERDLSAWLGNSMQANALHDVYALAEEVMATGDEKLIEDWRKLQTSDHFYYMCTKWFADGDVHKYFNPYESPYDAYINYMNILDNVRARIASAKK